MNIVNATPHTVNLLKEDGSVSRDFEPEVSIRVASNTTPVGQLAGINYTDTEYGDPVGLPPEREDTCYIVSKMVKDACPGRRDLLVPSEQVRDEKGRIIGCKSLGVSKNSIIRDMLKKNKSNEYNRTNINKLNHDKLNTSDKFLDAIEKEVKEILRDNPNVPENVQIVNATPHAVNLLGNDGNVNKEFQPEISIRIDSETIPVGELDGINFTDTEYGDPVGLPPERENVCYIVSNVVKDACPDRRDLLVPSEQVRDDKGRVIGCKSLGLTKNSLIRDIIQREKVQEEQKQKNEVSESKETAKQDVIYAGIFFDKADVNTAVSHLGGEVLNRVIDDPHVTLAFRPNEEQKQMIGSLMGKDIVVKLDEFACNDKNAGFLVSMVTPNPDVNNFLEGKLPHITTSVGENGRPVDTPKLFDGSFKNVSSIQQEDSQVLVGKIGVFCPDRQVHCDAKEIGLDGPDLTKDDVNLEK